MIEYDQQCDKCKFWYPHNPSTLTGKIQIGTCHRNPPAALGHQLRLRPPPPEVIEHRFGIWPTTICISWCGEFQPLLTENPNLTIAVYNTDLSVRTCNALHRENVETIGQLVNYYSSQLLEFKDFGNRCLENVREVLKEMGLYLKGEK